jgi:integrase
VASLEYDVASSRYRLRFRYADRSYKRSLKTTDQREARTVASRVEETIRLLEHGRLQIPPNADPAAFILSDGKSNGKPTAPAIRTLQDLFTLYTEKLPTGTKEVSTLAGEAIHRKHLLRHLKGSSVVSSMTAGDMQAYVEKRLQDKWRGEAIRPDTIKKELTTFRLTWRWAVDQGYLNGLAPLKGVKLPKRDQKPPFMTLDEIRRIIARGGLTTPQEAELWECLFLARGEVQEVLDYVQEHAQQPFVLPMFVIAAHTGARRSEILRSQIDDIDFRSRTMLIREKKKNHDKSLTYRRIPMTKLLLDTLTQWLSQHPGGQYTICEGLHTVRGKSRAGYEGLTRSEAHDHFKRTLRGSKWEKIRGFHVFRHSFASNLAAASVDQRIIDEWMGHQTEEQRHRYRHLFPDQQRAAIDSVFGGNGK